MKFTRTIAREVTFRSSARGIQHAHWVVEVGPRGVSARRKGARSDAAVSATWRQLIGFMLIHGAGRQNGRAAS